MGTGLLLIIRSVYKLWVRSSTASPVSSLDLEVRTAQGSNAKAVTGGNNQKSGISCLRLKLARHLFTLSGAIIMS